MSMRPLVNGPDRFLLGSSARLNAQPDTMVNTLSRNNYPNLGSTKFTEAATQFRESQGLQGDLETFCPKILVDPRDETRLIKVREARGTGDYRLAMAAYGLAAKEFIRVDCRTGVPLGIVPE